MSSSRPISLLLIVLSHQIIFLFDVNISIRSWTSYKRNSFLLITSCWNYRYIITISKASQGYTSTTLICFALTQNNTKLIISLFVQFTVHSLPHLTVLSLSGCSKVTDDGVELIAENLQKLRALDLSWCPRITDASLEYIACDLNQLEELTLDR